ncbi:MAG: hotdog fold thioesterase [Deltaproteobacteria bacterium]|nr:hotdog fold thioesterase [Deltaproteobacteria bacterium]
MDQTTVLRFFNRDVPFHAVVGLRVERAERGQARLVVPFRAELLGDAARPAIHGGVLATMIDVAGGAAVMSEIGEHDRTSTIDMRVDYLRPGEKLDLFADARIVRMGARVAVAAAVVHHGDAARPVAEGRLVFDIRRRPNPTGESADPA